jgi:hypothetical protein
VDLTKHGYESDDRGQPTTNCKTSERSHGMIGEKILGGI